ncbi:MAG: head-tail connector protein [Holosporales bacterium]|jgi:uncharacterized phiE125 gp8 family phage protein|nr:head-tail connector protein [Holosporales bacterium]
MPLTIIRPAEIPLIPLEEAKTYLRIDTDAEDALITRLISASTEALEAITGCAFLRKTYRYVTDLILFETSAYPRFKGLPTVQRLPLPRPPLSQILSVTIKTKTQEQEIPTENYSILTSHGPAQLTLTIPDPLGMWDRSTLAISFVAGWGETVREVPEPLRLATLMLVADAYEKRDGYSANAGLPSGVRDLIQPYRLVNIR